MKEWEIVRDDIERQVLPTIRDMMANGDPLLYLRIEDGVPVSRFEGATGESLLYAIIGVTIETPEHTDLSHKLLTVLARCEEQTSWLDNHVTFTPDVH